MATSVKVKQVLEALERFAPLPLQESWDNAGLQVGLTEAEVSGVLLCLDVTEAIIDEALRRGCNLVVSHHPLLFRGLKQVADMTDVQRTVRKAIRADVAVISMHTNMDSAPGGVNFKIAERLGLREVHFGHAWPQGGGDVPADTPEAPSGQWVMGLLPAAMEARAFIDLVKERLEVACARSNELLRRPVSRVAICGGAGDFLLDEAIAHGADAFITGEMHYHQYFGYEQRLQIVVTGHYESEHFTTEVFRDIISSECPGVPALVAETNTNPVSYW